MEPSLRSSHPRTTECKLRRTDAALHDTTKRFVESLSEDNRISQFADVNYASKKLAKDTWYWLETVGGGRSGYLVCLPNQPIVWMDEQFKQSYRIQMRISSSVYQKASVFIASLNKTDGLLRLEDCWQIAGKSLLKKSFTKRWEELLDFYATGFKADTLLQQGLRIEVAEYKSLKAILTWTPVPSMMLAQGETYPRRLRVQFSTDGKRLEHRPSNTAPRFEVDETSTVVQVVQIQEPPLTDSSVARAIAHEEYPDTYNLWIGGQQKGYAAVQDLDLSRQLRIATKEKREILVKVEWNEEFKMYEILSQV
jgi:hypothetical protein